MKTIFLVIPVYNEGDQIDKSLLVIRRAVAEVDDVRFRFVIIDDGSTDHTSTLLLQMCAQFDDIEILGLTRNFGKEAALMAGLGHAGGDAVIVMDCDLQHPPELIPQMVRLWLAGAEVVNACKTSRGKEGMVKKVLVKGFYRLFAMLAGKDLHDHSDFMLMDRKVVDAYLALPERKRFFRGLISWMGYPSARVCFDVPEREQGRSAWTSWNLARYSLVALSSFSSFPLYIVAILGAICLGLSLSIGGWTLYLKLVGQAVSGFTTVILLLLLIGSFIMIGLGLIGIYLGQIFNELKGRPFFYINKGKSRTRK